MPLNISDMQFEGKLPNLIIVRYMAYSNDYVYTNDS